MKCPNCGGTNISPCGGCGCGKYKCITCNWTAPKNVFEKTG